MAKRRLLLSVLTWVFYVLLLRIPQSSATQAKTDPSEARALNSIFGQWDVQAGETWNISGELCSGSALSATPFKDSENVPSIKCNCSYDNNATCHITRMRVQKLDRTGFLPKELTLLTYLVELRLDKNYFTGTFPAFISNLSALQELSFSHNAFYGAIPKELGNLKSLRLLAISSNNFSGTVPVELGNLVNLQQLYMDSCGAGGEIPSTFAKLSNLVHLFLSDNSFKGKIPEFIGNWTKLKRLKINGNSFEGPIPTSFSNLSLLEDLQICDLSNVSSSLDFIKDMKNLTSLVLRNALLSGSIPSYIGEYTKLAKLDLSFNNLTGQIPNSLFTSSSLTYLFLGNNSLSGVLPPYRSDQLDTIDVSYNHLSGTFPPWVTQFIQLNLVANNFIFSSTNDSIFPGLSCLQRDFPCNRNSPPFASFAIKCGGQVSRDDNGLVYEGENSIFSPASYFVSSTKKWGISNVGLFADMTYASYVQNAESPVVATDNPELFITSRISPGSLRYYGLGLKNGPYTVRLLFAETAFKEASTHTWSSTGRRVFDIYIQGSLEEKDFDISKEAGGVNRAYQKNISVMVSNNYLEIHLFWAGKGTCCIPGDGYYGPTISALSAASDLESPAVGAISPEKRSIGLIVGIAVAGGILGISIVLAVFYFRMKGSNDENEIELLEIGHNLRTFSYAELRTATRDFSLENKLGEGGFGSVYKGTLTSGSVIAVKRLSVASQHGKRQFLSELAIISVVQHRNLVRLYGCCIEGDKRLIVYEYLENKCLAQAIFGSTNLHLNWQIRFNICLGIARGLAYLHEESRPKIVHRDVKASNILLDAELSPKISDFGLAKLYDDRKTHMSTRVAGTVGYLAPEYAMRGHLTEKADVFGFGVVALEVLSGRSNFDRSLDVAQKYLLEWAWHLYENDRSLELVDPRLVSFNDAEADRVVRVALLCIQASPILRPSMSRVVGMLAGDIEVSATASKPGYLTDCDLRDTSSSFSVGDTATTSSTSDWI